MGVRVHDLAGGIWVSASLPLVASGGNTAYEALLTNPFAGEKAYIEEIRFIPIEAITGDNTNSFNLNVDLADATEIANLDFPTGVDGVRGTAKAFTITGTDAQRTLAAGASILIEREEVGTNPARISGGRVEARMRGYGG